MASSLFSDSNPFRRKPEKCESPAPVAEDAPVRKRKAKVSIGDEDSAGSKRFKAGTSESRKRKRKLEEEDHAVTSDEEDEPVGDAKDNDEGGGEEMKLQRTVFVGNLPTSTKKKMLIRVFSCFGAVESVRLRSVPVGTTKVPRKGAVNTGQLSDKRSSLNAFLVFKDVDSAKAALQYNMKQIEDKHIRVDLAQPSSEVLKNGVTYDSTRSVFVGNLPLDVEEEELYTLFADGSPEAQLEAVRVVRDQKTNIGKGFAFVLFKSKDGVKHTLARGELELRKRKLRVRRAKKPETTSTPVKNNKGGNPRRNRRPIPKDKLVKRNGNKVAAYEGKRATEKKQKKQASGKRISVKKPVVEKSGAIKKKRPAVAAKKAKQKGLPVASTKKKNTPSKKKKSQ